MNNNNNIIFSQSYYTNYSTLYTSANTTEQNKINNNWTALQNKTIMLINAECGGNLIKTVTADWVQNNSQKYQYVEEALTLTLDYIITLGDIFGDVSANASTTAGTGLSFSGKVDNIKILEKRQDIRQLLVLAGIINQFGFSGIPTPSAYNFGTNNRYIINDGLTQFGEDAAIYSYLWNTFFNDAITSTTQG